MSVLLKRQTDVRLWMRREAQAIALEQKHLLSGSSEQAYWHFGYLSALCDAIALLTSLEQRNGIADTSSLSPQPD